MKWYKMNIFKQIESELKLIIESKKQTGVFPVDVSAERVEATPPRDAAHGDIATNAAMVLAPQIVGNPMAIAGELVGDIKKIKGVAAVDIVKPGFINMTLEPGVWQDCVRHIMKEGRHYGDSQTGQGIRVNIEYVSANPTGPMHVGHGRGAVYGDALATLLVKAGYAVTKEYYINDAGAQVDKLAESAFMRYREACGEVIGDMPEGLYPGDYLVPVGQALYGAHGKALLDKSRDAWLPVVRDYTLDAMMDLIRGDLAVLGIYHDVFASERQITREGKVEKALEVLDSKGLIYNGVLEPPKGKMPEDWEPRPQTLFRSTQFGDDCDRPVKKSDGSWTYFAPDIAYHFDKCTRGFQKLIDVFGADHGGYVRRMKAAVEALSDGKVGLDIKLCQLVKFMRGGEPLKMSKRAGTFVTVREVVDEVGKDVFRFIMLTRKNDAPLDFDFARVMEQSKDNPVFYVQYAHARARSVIRRVGVELPDAMPLAFSPDSKTLARLSHPAELALIRLMCNWPRIVEAAALALEPHRVAFYLHDLAAAFHGVWTLGNDDLELRFLVKHDIELTAARVALAQAVSLVIASGLGVLGVEPVEEMR
jgi:arginyl-tRNA synthetase